ncbi:MAG: hypothetical protein IT423_12270, partial [Pirellulaceae bacterium]|nr:hypothetical protein [Pirellulaceae bacterium]
PVGAFVDESLRDSSVSVSESESGSSRGEIRLQPDYRSAIDHLYQRILFRPASQAELVEAYSLIRDVYGLESTISARSDELRFELTVTDPETMLQSQQLIRLPVDGDPLQVQQLLIDQTQSSASSQADNKSVNSQIAQQTLAESIWLEPGVAGQRVALHNLGTFRNVSFIGLDIYDVDSGTIVQTLSADADKMDKIELDGAWQVSDDDGISSFEDRNQHKGLSLIRVPLMVERAGAYKLVLRWRANPRNANNVLVELFSPRAGNTLVSSPLPVVPPKGQAQFYYDCSEDARAFFAPAASFQFDEQSLVRIANDGTLDQVTAGAIEFTSTQDTKNEFLIDSLDADGNQPWSRFDEGRFKAYNVKGTKLHDDNKHKGERELLYRLATKRENGWQPEQYYSLRVYYPGKRDQEAQVPLTVHAHRSSPIIQVAHPRVAKADATIHIDASSSYTVSHAALQYHWRQTGGTRVELADATSPKLTFVAPRRRVDQAAWVALCAALVRHPDFLFTRPTTLFATPDPTIKSRLQLVKLALDLVGRSPTQAELNMLTGGSTLPQMADRYLASDEFKQFYFHRIRLHLESQGTDVQDEPARLWCHVAFNERPFQEILTADYTADAQFQKQERPSYHGRTGVLTTRGFIQGKPGLPHYNYAAQVSMLFLGYVYEVPPEIVELREGVTALGTTDPNSVCYSCHKILTPLAFQRSNWTDDGDFRLKDEYELPIDASDRGASVDYPFTGSGLEAFATQAARKERFIRTIINTHVNFYFGRPLRHREDERELYRRLWEHVHETNFQIPALIRAIVTSPEYLEGHSPK